MDKYEITVWRSDKDNDPWVEYVYADSKSEAFKKGKEMFYSFQVGSIYDVLVVKV